MTKALAIEAFDMARAETCARLCAISYSDDQMEIQSVALDCGYDHISLYGYGIHHHDRETFLVWNDEEAVPVFRGTDSDEPSDILADLKFRHKDVGSGKVHRGFNEALDGVYAQLENQLFDLARSRRKLIITGHSLGGALACIAARRLVSRIMKFVSVYTYGCPRVGSSHWAADFDLAITHHRFVNCTDVVPRLPFFSMGFRHTGKLHYLNSKNELIIECGFWSAFVDRWQELLFGFCDGFSCWTFLRSIKDHSIYRYLERLRTVEEIREPIKKQPKEQK